MKADKILAQKKFKRSYFVIILVTIAMSTYAQVSIQTSVPTVGFVQKNQLWNIILVNSTLSSFEGRLQLVLRDRRSGNELMTASTAVFSLGKGSLQTNVNLLNPIQYTYSGMEPVNTLNGMLPVGAYYACFSFAKIIGTKQEYLAEECVSFDVEPLSPPMLMFPNDSSLFDVQPSQFTWMPPTPSGMINRLRYTLLISEIKLGQRPAEALQFNTPFYSSADISNNFLSYPLSLPAFEKDKWYAWQVLAHDGSNYAAKTDVWVFSTKSSPSYKVDSSNSSYILLNQSDKISGITYIKEHQLKIKYYSFDKNSRTVIRLFQADGKVVDETKQQLVYGDNFISLRLNKKFVQGQVYIVELEDSQKNRYKTLFSIQ